MTRRAWAGLRARPGPAWVSAWYAAQQGPYPFGFVEQPVPLAHVLPGDEARDQTFFLVVRLAVGGSALRLRLSNRFGDCELELGTVAANGQQVFFGGGADCLIPAGAEVVSDPLEVAVAPFDELCVAIHVRGRSGAITWHAKALASGAATEPGSGDRTGGALAGEPLRSWLWLSEVLVRSDDPPAVIVALGDSLTDGTTLAIDGYERWTDVLSRRLVPRAAVLNAGIGSNRIAVLEHGPFVGALLGLPASSRCLACGPTVLERLEYDALSREGLAACVVAGGLNDLAAGASAAGVIAGFHAAAVRLRRAGIVAVGCTIPGAATSDYGRACAGEVAAVNTWLRSTDAPFDAVADWAAALGASGDETRLDPALDGGDAIHPNADGHRRMADAVAAALGL